MADAISGFLLEEAQRDIKILFTIHLQSSTFVESLARHHCLQTDNDLRLALE